MSKKRKQRASVKTEYARELSNLKRRSKYWERRHGVTFEIPDSPRRITRKEVDKLKNIRYRNLTDVDEMRERYIETHPDITFDEAIRFGYRGGPLETVAISNDTLVTSELVNKYPELFDLYREQTDYDESDNYSNNEDDYYSDRTRSKKSPIDSTPPSITEQEIDSFIDSFIDSVTNYSESTAWSKYQSWNIFNAERCDHFAKLAYDQINFMRSKWGESFYNYLKQPGVVDSLLSVIRQLYGLSSDNRSYSVSNQLYTQFLVILNHGQALTDEQLEDAERLENVDIDFEEEW